MSSSDLGVAAINLAIETTSNALAVEQENAKLREQLHKNQQLLDDFDVAAPRAQLLQKQLKEKEALLEQKRKDLVEVQAAIISTLKNQSQEDPVQPSLESIPVVMNRVQRFVTDLTEAAVDQKTIAVPILQLFKVTDALNKLYDALVDTKVIAETKEEKEARVRAYVESQQEIITKLRAVAQQSQAAMKAQLVECEEEEEPEQPAPKVEQLPDQQQPEPEQTTANRPPTPEPEVPPQQEVGDSPVAEQPPANE
ncbi:hypothetical protein TRFO_33302 [Tritrichomonas foetus]|uniref:Uncharacterized protein n=1 Tax=Tritrichomonas foetus TaxID=1144522 RepID=A0A1J4JRC9_9EUKA|nr:hypothetical protein TRFO_33302 [Tritrichomonas foetus]|eukprot:OHT00068.1 hypothetical protein TRFO_33302 [Tritrichomonas foetus]